MDDIHIREDEPITVVFNVEISASDEPQFKALMSNVIEAAKGFKGFRGKHFFYSKSSGKINYNILMQFDNLKDLKHWEGSAVRQQFREKVNQLIGGTPSYHYLTGLESWFALGVNKPIIPPPRYKIALLTWASAYCLLLIIFTIAGRYLSTLNMPLRVFIVSFVMVLAITYFVMPLLTRFLKRWLYPTLTS
jgi:uncharacterized protein